MDDTVAVAAAIAAVSTLYATAGHAGGTAFLAVMAIATFPPGVRRSRRVDNRRAEAQIALIDELEPDVFLMLQKGFEAGAMRYCTRSRRGSEYAGSLPCPGKARREGRSAT